MPHLIVIAGPANSGKMPLAQEFIAGSPPPVLVHRDLIRQAIINAVDEWHLTLATVAMARVLLTAGHNVVTVGWNLDDRDRKLWSGLAVETEAEFTWLDTRDPKVHQMIPPLSGWTPAAFERD